MLCGEHRRWKVGHVADAGLDLAQLLPDQMRVLGQVAALDDGIALLLHAAQEVATVPVDLLEERDAMEAEVEDQ